MKLLPLLFVLLIFSWDATAASRVALVIGNQDYPNAPLENTLNDSRLVRDVLSEAGFNVIYRENTDFEAMNKAADAFGRALNKKSIGIFYFSGHGVQVDRINYLMPIKSKIEGPSDLKSRAVNLQLFLGKMSDAQNIANVAIIDACRNNPFTRGYRGGNGALVDVPVPGGTLVAYATAEGQLANDSSSDDHRHSPYTKALAKYMREPGLAIESVFTKVAKAVYLATNKHQDPHISGNLRETFVLTPLVQQRDREFWDTVKDSRDPRDFQSYLKEYPDGIYTGLAKVKIRKLATTEKATPENTALPYETMLTDTQRQDRRRLQWSLKGDILKTFDSLSKNGKGIEIATVVGSYVRAVDAGRVVFSGNSISGYGEVIILQHKNDLFSVYGFNQKRLVQKDDYVRRGDKIAISGRPPSGGKPRLRFELREGKQAVDPIPYME